MAVLTRPRERRARWITGAHPRDPALAEWFGGGDTAAGVAVSPETAMTLSAVLACVRLLSETMASLPLITYRLLANEERESDPEHPIYDTLKRRPNRWQTSFEWREYLGHAFLLRGFGAAEIFPREDGYPVGELVPLHPDRVTPFRAPDGSRAYRYQPESGASRIILQDEMLYVPFLPGDGYRGVSVIKHAAETIGSAIAAERYGGSFFGEGSTPGGVLEHPGELSAEAQKNLMQSWEDRHRVKSGGRRHRIQILEEGMTFRPITISPEDAQLLETRKNGLGDIARIFLTPPHLIGDVERSTSWGSGIEQQGIGFVTYAMRSLLVRFEQAMMRDLFTEAGRKTHFVEFNVDGLLRGDQKSRYEAYQIGKQNGWLTTNRILRTENMRPIGPEGDVMWQPMNMTPATIDGMSMTQRVEAAGALVKGGWDADGALAALGLPSIKHTGRPPVTVQSDQIAQRRQREDAFRALFEETSDRIVRRRTRDSGRTAAAELRRQDVRDMTPVLLAFARAAGGSDDTVLGILDGFAGREGFDVDRELRRLSNAIAYDAGARDVVRGDGCEECCAAPQEMRHPPYHDGCTCDITGGTP